MKSVNLNFLEPSGPLQACNGTALPIYLIALIVCIVIVVNVIIIIIIIIIIEALSRPLYHHHLLIGRPCKLLVFP
jgi:hypothetical protein